MNGTGPDRIVVIGGGISGLSSAFYLLREAEKRGQSVEVTLVEAADRLGGKIETLHRDGFVIEKGPDSFLARKTAMIELARELGIADELTGTNPAAQKTYILHGGALHPIPKGMVLGVPTDIASLLKSSLLTVEGKFRATQDLLIPAKAGEEDESIGAFLERRFGREMVERVAEPLLAGIYAGDLDELSLQATFPQFRQAELEHGSLIRGTRHSRRQAAAAPPLPKEAQGSVFLTFRRGLYTLVEALEKALAGCDIRLGTKVNAVRRPDGRRGYEVELGGGETIRADGVVVTTPAWDAANLLEPLVDCSELRGIRYVSVANVVMAFDKADVDDISFDATGFVAARTDGRTITASTWTSAKWPHTSPDDKVLVRCYVGSAGDQHSPMLPDDRLIQNVRRDIRETMGITAEPLFVELTRLARSMPQYPVGHVGRTARFRTRLAAALPGVQVTGAAFDGVGLPDCIRQGKKAAAAVLDALS